MAAIQREVELQAVELATEAFETFCEDISGMFDVDMTCTANEVVVETVKELKKRFKKLVAVDFVKADGALNGTFQLIFDQGGLFTLSGVIVMLPENRILEEIKRGTIKDVESMNDAVKEAGNLLVGSWDRIFREGLEGHGHFQQTDTFIGTPWDDSEKTIGLTRDEELVFVPYEMTIGSYPVFKCGVIFPKTIFEPTSESKPEKSEPEAEEEVGTDSDEKESVQETGTEAAAESKSEEQTGNQGATAEKDDSGETETAAQNGNEESKPEEPVEEKAPAVEAAPEQKSDDVDTGVADNVVEAEATVTTQTSESKEQSVSETIRNMAQSPADFPGRLTHISSSICAKDIMEKEVVWGSPDDSVEQTLAKMQQADVGYVMIGTDGVLVGIVSKSNIAEAISPYLRPIFAKWRRPQDDATLHIKVKWMMSRAVRAIKPETPLMAIIENMSQFGGRCLPVVDRGGKVQGLVTVFDIFKVLLNTDPNISTVGKTLQAPPLVQLDS
jgi:acetoin utilization protein AcuB